MTLLHITQYYSMGIMFIYFSRIIISTLHSKHCDEITNISAYIEYM